MTCHSSLGLLLACAFFGTVSAKADSPAAVRSAKSGAWSAADTWEPGRAPKAGDRVLVRRGHHVTYDVRSPVVIRLVQIAGTLEFSRNRDTELNVGLIRIAASEDLKEEGFDCHATLEPHEPKGPRPALLVGTPNAPIPAAARALIRLHYVEGMDKESCPAIVCCGGRMDFHGAPLDNAWVKLGARAERGQPRVVVTGSLEGWKPDDRIIITSTQRRRDASDKSQTEERVITAIGDRIATSAKAAEVPSGSEYEPSALPNDVAGPAAAALKLASPFGGRDVISNGRSIQFKEKLAFDHDGQGDFRGEVANLSRNVVIESADPNGVRGHTMYHAHSQGSISYAEFRHLGKKDVLGRYAIHFHLVRDTMRGSFVKGASIWDSHNRWVVLHGTEYMVVRDCVGYQSVGHGYFLEDGTEVFNVLQNNLAVLATAGKPLPKQVIPFDLNSGAGFWWANCHNAISENVAADCDEYGFRFDVKRSDDFNPMLSILQPDGSRKVQDVRTLPFIKFENNEAHAIKVFAMSLRGAPLNFVPGSNQPPTGDKFHNDRNAEFMKEMRESTPDQRYPFWVRNFKGWETNFGYNAGTSGVFIDGLNISRSNYGMWRVVLDRNIWRGVVMNDIAHRQVHMPFSLGPPNGDGTNDRPYFVALQGFVDDFAPHTVITRIVRVKDEVLVCGSSTDTSQIKRVLVNGRRVYSTRDNYAEWEVVFGVPSDKPFSVSAYAEDILGNVEPRPHRIEVPALPGGKQ